jgi:hypothetical protein
VRAKKNKTCTFKGLNLTYAISAMAGKQISDWSKESFEKFEHERVLFATSKTVGDPDTEFYVFKDQNEIILTLKSFFISDTCFVNINNTTLIKFDDLKYINAIYSDNQGSILKLKNGESYTILNTPVSLLAESLRIFYDEEDIIDSQGDICSD